ncbi:MAG TPA: hypothetical protein ENF89_02500, partial [Candidatus Bathyarchaeota archaeon]|nr:hypothetical protein [Candidatus Bathyarchaeota archaeon]
MKKEEENMAIIVEGRGMALVVLLLSYILFYVFMYLGRKGREIPVRTLPPMAAIPEGIGRAAEMGRPVMFTPGIAGD